MVAASAIFIATALLVWFVRPNRDSGSAVTPSPTVAASTTLPAAPTTGPAAPTTGPAAPTTGPASTTAKP